VTSFKKILVGMLKWYGLISLIVDIIDGKHFAWAMCISVLFFLWIGDE